MRSAVSRITVPLLLLLAVAPVRAEGEPDKPLDWRHPAEWKGAHYLVKSCTSEGHAEETGALLEGLYEAFFSFTKGTPLRLHDVRNLPVTVYPDREIYLEAMKEIDAKRGGGFGFYSTTSGAIYCYRRTADGREATSETLLHEGTHQLVDQAANGCKTTNKPGYWVEEGLADYFGGGRIEDGAFVVGIRGVRLYRIMQMLKKGEIEPLERFVVRTRDGFENGPYAQACLFTHFLMHEEDGRYRKLFFAYAKLIFQSRGSDDTFEKAFRCKPAKFDEPFRKYLERIQQEQGEGTKGEEGG